MEASRIIWNLFVLANTSTAAQYGVHAIAFFLSPCLSASWSIKKVGLSEAFPQNPAFQETFAFPELSDKTF